MAKLDHTTPINKESLCRVLAERAGCLVHKHNIDTMAGRRQMIGLLPDVTTEYDEYFGIIELVYKLELADSFWALVDRLTEDFKSSQ